MLAEFSWDQEGWQMMYMSSVSVIILSLSNTEEAPAGPQCDRYGRRYLMALQPTAPRLFGSM